MAQLFSKWKLFATSRSTVRPIANDGAVERVVADVGLQVLGQFRLRHALDQAGRHAVHFRPASPVSVEGGLINSHIRSASRVASTTRNVTANKPPKIANGGALNRAAKVNRNAAKNKNTATQPIGAALPFLRRQTS